MEYFKKLLNTSLQGNRKSFAVLELNAKTGNPSAQYYLALYYKKRYGKVDDRQYLYWLNESKRNGHRPMLATMGLLKQERKPDWMPRQENKAVNHLWLLMFHLIFLMIKSILANSDVDYSTPAYMNSENSSKTVLKYSTSDILYKGGKKELDRDYFLKLLKEQPVSYQHTHDTIETIK